MYMTLCVCLRVCVCVCVTLCVAACLKLTQFACVNCRPRGTCATTIMDNHWQNLMQTHLGRGLWTIMGRGCIRCKCWRMGHATCEHVLGPSRAPLFCPSIRPYGPDRTGFMCSWCANGVHMSKWCAHVLSFRPSAHMGRTGLDSCAALYMCVACCIKF